MFAYEHRQQHETSVFVDHPDRFCPLLCEYLQSEAVHRCDLNIEQAACLKVFQCLLLSHQSVLIGHQNKRLTSVLFNRVVDETLLIYILSARI